MGGGGDSGRWTGAPTAEAAARPTMDNVFGKAKRVVLQLEDELAKLEQSVQAGAAPAEVPAQAVANGDSGPPLSLQGTPAATATGASHRRHRRRRRRLR